MRSRSPPSTRSSRPVRHPCLYTVTRSHGHSSRTANGERRVHRGCPRGGANGKSSSGERLAGGMSGIEPVSAPISNAVMVHGLQRSRPCLHRLRKETQSLESTPVRRCFGDGRTMCPAISPLSQKLAPHRPHLLLAGLRPAPLHSVGRPRQGGHHKSSEAEDYTATTSATQPARDPQTLEPPWIASAWWIRVDALDPTYHRLVQELLLDLQEWSARSSVVNCPHHCRRPCPSNA